MKEKKAGDKYEFADFPEKSDMVEIDKLRKLAYHEAGHFVMNALLRKVPFTIEVSLFFPSPKSMWVSEDTDCGQVEGVGLPIYGRWSDSDSGKEFVDRIFSWPNPYSSNKKLAFANVFLSVAGFASDLSFVRPDREICSFGSEKGEHPDRKNAQKLLGLILGREISDLKEKEEALSALLNRLIEDVREILNAEKVSGAIHKVAGFLMKQDVDQEGKRRGSDNELQKLYYEIMKEVDEYDIQVRLDKYG